MTYLGCSPVAAPLAGVALFLLATPALAASCCGGGGGSFLVLPKVNGEMIGITSETEHYDGLWRRDGTWVADPPGSDLNQHRVNLGYARRLGERWQGAVNLPYVWNRNRYAGFERETSGLGDASLSLLYETFDSVTCVYQVRGWEDLRPAVYLGAALTIPTGISPYDDVADNFDITGRGFYRLEGTVLAEKTVFPWNVGVQVGYAIHPARPVNREYGNYEEPYTKRLGDRVSGSASFGYTWMREDFATWTGTLAYAAFWEGHATVSGAADPTTGVNKRSLAATVAWASPDRGWVVKGTWGYSPREDGWGGNFPATTTVSLGLSRTLR